jgi:cell division transport system permease protein
MDARALRRLRVAIRSGFRGLFASPLVFVASVSTMTAGLLVLAGYLLLVQNMRHVMDRFAQDLQIVAFLSAGESASPTDVAGWTGRLDALEGVRTVRFVPSEAALERLRRDLGEDSAILDGLERNPLPGSFELEIEPSHRAPEALRAIAVRVRSVPGIDEVRYGEDWAEGYARVVRVAELLGVGLATFLILVLGAIVAGTVRLGVHVRADEIQIQRLVGAGALFVRLPFYLTGALQGGIASLLAIGLLWAFWGLGLPALAEPLEFLVGASEPVFFGLLELGLLFALGVGLGAGGAVVSLFALGERS